MGRRLRTTTALAIAGGLVVALLAPAGASARSARTAPAARSHETAACAVPDDCTLREAAEIAGVVVGIQGRPTPANVDVLLADSMVQLNHSFSWRIFEPTRDVWSFAAADEAHAFAQTNGLEEIAFHFAWAQPLLDDLPAWARAIDDPVELRAELAERAQTIFSRYPDLGRITVVNEPIEALGGELVQEHFADVLGPDWVEEIWTIAEASAPPTVDLVLNENLVEYVPAKADRLVALTEELLAGGHRVDVVGLQMHLFFGEPDWDLLDDLMARLGALGVRVMISELDAPVPDTVPARDEVQADRMRRSVESCLAEPACDAIVFWDVDDSSSWVDDFLAPGLAPTLRDVDQQRKPSWFAVRDALLLGRPAFDDVGARHRFFGQIQWLAHHAIAGGYADGGFHPTAPVSRQALAAMLARAVGTGGFVAPTEPTFTDVPLDHPFFAEIEWLASAGIAGGYADGGFHPAAPVSRQAAAALLHRLAGEPTPPPLVGPTFPDVPLGSTFSTPIEWLASTGIAGGYADGGFHPVAAVSRQAAASFLWGYDAAVSPLG